MERFNEEQERQSSVEDILLRHSGRGMEALRACLPGDYCRRAARQIYALSRGRILLTTGFYVNGAAETDGPPGTACLAMALERLGFICTIVTDSLCKNCFEPLGLQVEYLAPGQPADPALLDRLEPVALLSVERCGRNDEGHYANMRGESIDSFTASVDELFALARARGIFTLGVGDGGNEIGMGALAEVIRQKLSLRPCTVETDALLVASVSNWGAYGLAACLEVLAGRMLLPGADWLEQYLDHLNKLGCVDGVTRQPTPTVDGYAPGVEVEMYDALQRWAEHCIAL